jgi:hypothetical protein
LTHALRVVRDDAAARRLVDALRRARDVVPGLEGRPASGTSIALLRRCLVQEEQRAEASPDGRSDLAGLPEAVAAQGASEKAAVLHRAALGVTGSIIDPVQPRMDNRARTHCAGLQRDPQLATCQPFLQERSGGGANRENFGMSGRIMIGARHVVRRGDHHTVLDDHRPDGHFACAGGLRGSIQRGAH